MELLVYCKEDGYNSGFHHEKNKENLKKVFLTKTIPDELHIINNVPDLDFTAEFYDKKEPTKLTSFSRIVLSDLCNSNSSINEFLGLSDDCVDEKCDTFLAIFEAFISSFFKYPYETKNVTSLCIFYGDIYTDLEDLYELNDNSYHFKISMPNKEFEKFYKKPNPLGPCHYDITKLDKKTWVKYIAFGYYKDLFHWDREKVRTNPELMNILSLNWVNTLSMWLD